MERIRYFADLSIRRGCAFGLLAIVTTMIGMASNMTLAVKLGAICVTMMGAILVIKAMRAPTRDYRRTEVWIMLEKRHDLPEGRAQQVFGNILRDRYMWHATLTAGAAFIMWTIFLVLLTFGRGPQA
jgi:hypothetical protein